MFNLKGLFDRESDRESDRDSDRESDDDSSFSFDTSLGDTSLGDTSLGDTSLGDVGFEDEYSPIDVRETGRENRFLAQDKGDNNVSDSDELDKNNDMSTSWCSMYSCCVSFSKYRNHSLHINPIDIFAVCTLS